MLDLTNCTKFTSGEKFSIWLTPNALETLEKLKADQSNAQGVTALANLFAKMSKYCETGKLHSPDELNDEDDGFYSFKNDFGFRAYWWYYGKQRGVILISHFILKKRQKLKKSDKKIMISTRDLFEE